MRKTGEVHPTLPDSQVLDFCKKGYLILASVVPDEINRRVVEYTDEMVRTRPELRTPRPSG